MPVVTAVQPTASPAVRGRLGFARPERIEPDAERRGLLRARTIEPAPLDDTTLDVRPCEITDLASHDERPTLAVHGFERVTLAPTPGLREVLATIRDQRSIGAADARALRRLLTKGTIALADGSRLKIVYVAGDGVIIRCAGPAGIDRDGNRLGGDHDGAVNVHIDQDILGTPVRQMLRGAAPTLFHHDAPDSANHRSPLWLVNVWLPLHQITRPLALVDVRTVERRSQQLRYALPTEGILDRDQSRNVNDIWSLRHDPAQRWYFTSELGIGDAYVFDTLGTPHGAFHLPGEEIAADRYRRLVEAERALDAADTDAVVAATAVEPPSPGAVATAPLAAAVATMDDVLVEARIRLDALVADGDARARWVERSAQARANVVRSSVEVRAVAVRLPGRRRALPPSST